MKNFKFYKSALALLTAATITLMSGCSGELQTSENKENKKSKPCMHLTIYFADEPITFKECEGYKISATDYSKDSDTEYTIKKDGEILFSGITTLYNKYNVYHDTADKLIEVDSIQKVK